MSSKSSKRKEDKARKTQASHNKTSSQGKFSKKEDKGEKEIPMKAIGGKDTTLFLFRALGKILYCKRKE